MLILFRCADAQLQDANRVILWTADRAMGGEHIQLLKTCGAS